MKPLRQHPRAIALVITLVILVIATILIVAFVTTMRTERRAASAVANDARTKLIAQSALEHALAILDKHIPQPIAPGLSGSAQLWSVNPGLLTVFPTANNPNLQSIPLSSDTNTASTATLPQGDSNTVVNHRRSAPDELDLYDAGPHGSAQRLKPNHRTVCILDG